MHKVAVWTMFGLAVRFWQLAIEMRPFFNRGSLWAYPVFGGVGGSFGYWLMGVSERQNAALEEHKFKLLAKRKRRDDRLKAEEEKRLAEGGVVDEEEAAEKKKKEDRGFLLGRY